MHVFIKIFFLFFSQYILTGKGDHSDVTIAGQFEQLPVVYSQVVFTIRGDEHAISTSCMEQDGYLGISDSQPAGENGVQRIVVQFNRLPAAKLDVLAALISKRVILLNVETKL